MSDIRFILAGVAVVFVGFLILGVFGTSYRDINAQAEFEDCIEYSDRPPQEVDCQEAAARSMLFFGMVIVLLGIGIYLLIRGYRGKWDNEVKPEEMLGPGHRDDKPP